MDWKFRGYKKIAEATSDWRIDEATFRKLARIQWVVTEKNHGANFCLICDGEEILCAKRKALLGEDEDFFHHEGVRRQLSAPILELFASVQADDENLNRVYSIR